MKKQLLVKIKESLISVLPVTLIVFILSFTPLLNLSIKENIVFFVSAIFLVLGISLFNLGADIAMTPMGDKIGYGLTKSKSVFILIIVCFFLGFLITIAEPDLQVLANQLKSAINSTTLILFVAFGVGLFLILAVLKIIFKTNLSSLLMFFYMMLFCFVSLLVINDHSSFLAIAFDSGGVTTGPITVPFIMALGVGIARALGGKNSGENSFGLISMCSVGPILAVMILGLFMQGELAVPVTDYSMADNLFKSTFSSLFEVTKSVSLALGLIVFFFFLINFIFLHLKKKKLIQILIGILYTYVGLIIFLTAVEVGFMPIGYKMGSELIKSSKWFTVIFSFILGMVVVLAEPAIHVLNKQVEDITDGTVSKKSMMIALCIGVGISLGLSIIRILYDFSILYYVIPGYLISLALSFFVPKMYTAIAFDSGGVASGPLTSSFILPFAIGTCEALGGNILNDAFGIVAMVAMTPLITIQLLGFRAIVTSKVKEKVAMKKILDADDEQIIDFM